MQPLWLSQYSKGIPHEIDPGIYKNVLEVFEEAVKKFPSHTAFVNMGKKLSYSELNSEAEAFAAFLQSELGLKKGDRFAIQLPNVLQFPIAMFGALKAGLIIVNTNPLYTEREMKHQFADAGCKAVIILANFAHSLQKILSETPIQHVIVTEIGDQLSFPKSLLVNFVIKKVKKMVPPFHIPGHWKMTRALSIGRGRSYSPTPMTLDEIAFLQYTGGTTGVSKGAMLTHRNVVANMLQICAWMKSVLREGQEIATCALPLYHIFCLTVNGLAILRFGGTNILITNPRDMKGFVKELSQHKFTVITGVNTLFNGLLNHPEFEKLDFSTLRISVAGGMALQNAVAQRWHRVTGTPVVEGYGLTETSPVACVNPIDGRERAGSIGLPVPSTALKLIDDDGNEVQPGPGEICIRGPQVMKGYWNRPDETAQVLSSDGWLRTGDIGVVDNDGYFRIVDRKKDMILVSGFNVYPNEVEDVIAHCPGVVEVAAIGVPDEKSGEVVKIFVVRKDDSLTAEKLISFSKEQLAGYKVPKFVEFRKELPKTNVGKILRRELRDGPVVSK